MKITFTITRSSMQAAALVEQALQRIRVPFDVKTEMNGATPPIREADEAEPATKKKRAKRRGYFYVTPEAERAIRDHLMLHPLDSTAEVKKALKLPYSSTTMVRLCKKYRPSEEVLAAARRLQRP